MSKYDELYAEMCSTCVNAVRCHEECIECDLFLEALEEDEI